jgi:hypothetical protein
VHCAIVEKQKTQIEEAEKKLKELRAILRTPRLCGIY